MNPTALPGHILSRKARPVLALLKRPLLAGLRIPLLVTSLAWGLSAAPATAQAAGCQFVLGFATLQTLGSSDVGNCVDDQAFAANGDALQHTDKGFDGLAQGRQLDRVYGRLSDLG